MTASMDQLDGKTLDGLDFCAKAYALFEQLRTEPGAVKRLTLRTSKVEKRLLDEIFPICRYIQTYYRPGRYISVRWLSGSQSYEAELQQRGDYVNLGYFEKSAFLEVTSAMHPNEHWSRKLLSEGEISYAPEGIDSKKGTPLKSEPVVFSNFEHVLRFTQFVVASIRNKSISDYPDNTSLIVLCHLNNLYTPEDWLLLVSEVERAVDFKSFREVLLLDALTDRFTPLALPVL